MGENLGTIDASAYLIVPRGITRCPNASASSGSTPKTGRPFNNIHSGRSKRLTSCYALLYFSAIQRFNGHKRQASHALAWSAKLIHSIKIVLASGPPPSIQMRRFPLFDDTPDPAQRRHNIVQLHAEGWSVASIAEYLGVSKQTVYTTLKRWWQEGVKGLDDKSHTRKAPRKVTLEVTNEIRKKQENPLIGEWRMHAVLLQEGIKLSPRTCGRIMAKNRAIYGWDKPKAPPKPKKEMPFKAARRHEYWSIDIRYIEHHQLPDIKGPVYVISILENFSRMLLASAISEKQDTAAYLRVLAKALRNYGAPEAIVTDSGGVFYSKRAMAIYEALDIRKERIDPRQSWQIT